MRKYSLSSPALPSVDRDEQQPPLPNDLAPRVIYTSSHHDVEAAKHVNNSSPYVTPETSFVYSAETPSSRSSSDDGTEFDLERRQPADLNAIHVLTDLPKTSPFGAIALESTARGQHELDGLSDERRPSSIDNLPPWSELPLHRKLWSITKVLLKLLVAVGCLYVFICALSLMADSLRMLAGRQTNSLFSNGLLRNPVVGLMIGLLVTVVLHSSATATSITIAMSAAGVLPVENAIYIVMGANIGTTVTSSCVSLIQIGDRQEFQRAFAGASLGSVFNWLSVLIFLPLEVVTGFLRWISGHIVAAMHLHTDKGADRAYLKKLTEPVTRSILQAVSIGGSSTQKPDSTSNFSIPPTQLNKTMMNELSESTNPNLYANESVLRHNATFLFANTSLSDTQIGIITGLISLAALCIGLVSLVKALHSLLGGKLAYIVKRVVNAHLPGVLRYFTGYLFIAFSVVAAILIQSSSIFTSTLTPLVGVGIVSLERMYTFTLGSDLGTTLTGVLAALATDANQINVAMQVAMAHLVFNALGILLFYPIPFMRWPISMADWMGQMTAQYRWFPIFYITLLYFIMPAIVIGLSLAGTLPLLIVCIPTLLLFVFVLLINFLQNRRPNWLPRRLRNWNFLPEYMRSFAPYDRAMMRMSCYKKLAACSAKKNKRKKSAVANNSDSTQLSDVVHPVTSMAPPNHVNVKTLSSPSSSLNKQEVTQIGFSTSTLV